MSEGNEGIKAAYDELESLKNDDERRQIYLAREKAIIDYKVQNRAAREEGIKEGITQGLKQGREEALLQTARNMIKNGLSTELISRITGLTHEIIESIYLEDKNN